MEQAYLTILGSTMAATFVITICSLELLTAVLLYRFRSFAALAQRYQLRCSTTSVDTSPMAACPPTPTLWLTCDMGWSEARFWLQTVLCEPEIEMRLL